MLLLHTSWIYMLSLTMNYSSGYRQKLILSCNHKPSIINYTRTLTTAKFDYLNALSYIFFVKYNILGISRGPTSFERVLNIT